MSVVQWYCLIRWWFQRYPLNSFLLQRNFYQFYDRDGGKQKKRCDARAICDKGIKMSGHDVCIQKSSIFTQHPFLTETELYSSFEIESNVILKGRFSFKIVTAETYIPYFILFLIGNFLLTLARLMCGLCQKPKYVEMLIVLTNFELL